MRITKTIQQRLLNLTQTTVRNTLMAFSFILILAVSAIIGDHKISCVNSALS